MCDADFKSIGFVTQNLLNRFQIAARLRELLVEERDNEQNGPDNKKDWNEIDHVPARLYLAAGLDHQIKAETEIQSDSDSSPQHSDHLIDDKDQQRVDPGAETDSEDATEERAKDHHEAVNSRLRDYAAFERRANKRPRS